MRVFISPTTAASEGRRACNGEATRFKVYPYYQRNLDRSVDYGFRVRLFGEGGVQLGWLL